MSIFPYKLKQFSPFTHNDYAKMERLHKLMQQQWQLRQGFWTGFKVLNSYVFAQTRFKIFTPTKNYRNMRMKFQTFF